MFGRDQVKLQNCFKIFFNFTYNMQTECIFHIRKESFYPNEIQKPWTGIIVYMKKQRIVDHTCIVICISLKIISTRWSLADKLSAWLGWATCRQSIFNGNSGILIMSPIMIKKFNVFNFVIGKDDELLLWGPLWFKSVFYFVIGKGRLYWSFHWNIHIQQQYIFSEHLAVPSIDNTRQYCYL